MKDNLPRRTSPLSSHVLFSPSLFLSNLEILMRHLFLQVCEAGQTVTS